MEAALREGAPARPPAEETEQTPEEPGAEQITTDAEAIERICHESRVYGGIKVGCKEVIRAIENKTAKFVVCANDTKEPAILKIIEGLCQKADKPIPMVKVDQSKDLGRWAGLCKTDKEGQARKIVGASSVAVVGMNKNSSAADYLKRKYEVRAD